MGFSAPADKAAASSAFYSLNMEGRFWRQSGLITQLSPGPPLSSCSSHLSGCPNSSPGGWDDWVALSGSSHPSRCGVIWEAGLCSYHCQMPNKPGSGPQPSQPSTLPRTPHSSLAPSQRSHQTGSRVFLGIPAWPCPCQAGLPCGTLQSRCINAATLAGCTFNQC